ncbi:MAG TPA: aryl-sulfate sulfotransferase [Bryobacteraceae bacterium]|nr:aryl-sulfate sulfotransferase [Bryobacteraceae bacterium]
MPLRFLSEFLQSARLCVFWFTLGAIGIATSLNAAIVVTLTPSTPSPASVGMIVTWNAAAGDDSPGTLWYRFRSREAGGSYRVIRDYGPLNSLGWTASDHEGTYQVEVSVRNRDTGETAAVSEIFQMNSRVTGKSPVINPTLHPLVFLYSAPACPPGNSMRVQFQSAGGMIQRTPYKNCSDGKSMNFYIAGLIPETKYSVKHSITDGTTSTDGPTLSFTSGILLPGLITPAIVQPPSNTVTVPILLQSTLFIPAFATDLSGNVLWYNPTDVTTITRVESGGYFVGTIEGGNDTSLEVVREFDLVGTTLAETNVARVNEQLAAMGKRQISAFHHEARTLPDGKILVLADVEQILTDVQGPGPVDVIGDMIIVLDSNLQVAWTWDTFDRLDPSRAAVLGETCLGSGACAPYYLAADANDWTHGNAVALMADGNLLFSSRHQDWIIKIEYQNGAGSGAIIWRLGKDGDFQFDSTDPYPWFSHQHDPNFEAGSTSMLLVFDNGNTRIRLNGGNGNSRGQMIQLDETNRIATVVMNADMGAFSQALGSAQQLADSDCHFEAGWVADSASSTGFSSYSEEVDPGGNLVFETKMLTQVYRSFRMTTMYNPN